MHAPRAIWNPARDVWEDSGLISLFSELPVVYSETWPPSGSMRSGRVCVRPTLAPLIAANGSSSSPGLPTPRSRDHKGPGYEDDLPSVAALLPTPRTSDTNGPGVHGDGGLDLRTAVTLLPTSTSSVDSGGLRPDGSKYGPTSGTTLTDVVVRLLPTPSASNPNDGEDLDNWTQRRARVKETAANGNGFGMPLSIAVRLLPTPTTQPSTGNGHARNLGTEIKKIGGERTPPPSPDGNTSPDDPPPPPPTNADG